MSSEQHREHHSKRILRTESASKRQARIAKQHLMDVTSEHRFAKSHAMNCGNPKCHMCMNPRKAFGNVTIQEQRFYQDRFYEEFSNE
jgi:hypothetical protein